MKTTKTFTVNVVYNVERGRSQRTIERPLDVTIQCDENDCPSTAHELDVIVLKYTSQHGLLGFVTSQLRNMEASGARNIIVTRISGCQPK